MRVVSWNIASLQGSNAAIEDVFAHLASDDRPGFEIAPHLLILQEVSGGEQNTLLSLARAAVPEADYQLATYTNAGEQPGAQALIYRGDSLVEIPTGHADLLTGASRRSDRWRMRWLAASADEGTFLVYGTHLKASQGSSNEQQRLEGAIVLRNDMDGFPAGTGVILGGDLNVYDHLEPAFLELQSPGANPLVDPLGGGPWGGSTNAVKHTQSPRASASGGLVGGGLDDRFDFVMVSGAFDDDVAFSLIPNTYRAVGNDGLHFNGSINTGNNFYFPNDVARSNDLADDLFIASDHIPVAVDFAIPAVMTVDAATDLGRAIEGAVVFTNASITNTADVVIDTASDILLATYSATGDLFGAGQIAAVPLGAPQELIVLANTNTAGTIDGTVEIATVTPGVLDPTRSISISATIVRPSAPSLDAATIVVDGEVTVTSPPDVGVIPVDVPVFNVGWDALQATLDLDGATGLGKDFTLAGLAQGIETGGSVDLDFDTTGRAPGDYEAAITIETSDEDIPGEDATTLTVLVRVTIEDAGGPLEDLDGDGVVGFGDLVLLLADFGDCPGGGAPCPADFDGNGAIDFGDLVQLLAAWD